MTPQKPAPKKYAVAYVETFYAYHDTLEAALAEYHEKAGVRALQEVGVTVEVWSYVVDDWKDVWSVLDSREFQPIHVTLEGG